MNKMHLFTLQFLLNPLFDVTIFITEIKTFLRDIILKQIKHKCKNKIKVGVVK